MNGVKCTGEIEEHDPQCCLLCPDDSRFVKAVEQDLQLQSYDEKQTAVGPCLFAYSSAMFFSPGPQGPLPCMF